MLHTLSLGETGSRVVFLHGLFGQGRNWLTIAKSLADRHRVTLVDLPNHGRSDWSDHVDYLQMADAVAELLESGESDDAGGPVSLIGHSMGGKVAMVLALRRPELASRLLVADMSPVDYPVEDDATTGGVLSFAQILRDLDLSQAPRREEIDQRLAPAIPDPTVRGFLLQNLRRDGAGGWGWAANVDVLAREGSVLAQWPAERLAGLPPYGGPVVWVAGERSSYVLPAYEEAMRQWFPRVRKVTMKGVGHWVHSENPAVFGQIVEKFLTTV